MAKGPGNAVPSLPVKVVIQPSAGSDGQLLFEAVSLTQNKSGLINQLAMRGWLNLLHGTPAIERSIQLRMIGLPDDVIAQVDALAPAPHFLSMDGAQRAAAAPPPPVQPASRPPVQPRRQPAAVPADDPGPTSAPQEPVQQEAAPQPKDDHPPAPAEEPRRDAKIFSPTTGSSRFGGSGFGGSLS